MTQSGILKERERAFEEVFFQKRNQELLEAMRARKTREEQFVVLSSVLGVESPALIDPLLDLGLRGENVTALVLAPLIAVAWADRTLDKEERRAILKAEEAFGIDPKSEAGQLLENWLDNRPDDSLLDAWAGYVGALCRVLKSRERESLRDDIVSRSHRIARAIKKSIVRGGGPTEAEKATVARIETAFEVEGSDPDGDSQGLLDKIACGTT